MSRIGMKEKFECIVNKYWIYLLWIASWIFVSLVDFNQITNDRHVVRASFFVVFIIVFVRYLIKEKMEYDEKLIRIFMLGSFIVRLVFVLFHNYNFSYHDLGSLAKGMETTYQDGHLGYIQYIYFNGHLPDFDPRTVWSFYHPPFYYIVASVFMKINTVFGLDMKMALENLQMLTMLFATMTIQVGYKILKEFQLSARTTCFAFLIVAFHPYFIYGGATPNNDMLSILFIFMAILFTIRWYKNSTYKEIIFLAISIGLGMMTKLSVGIVAPAVAVIFLVKFIREKAYVYYFKQFVLFGLICIPLGMFWSIRNTVLYGMPLVYVQQIGYTSTQDLRNIAVWKRLNPFDFSNYGYPGLNYDTQKDYNIWSVMFRSSMFDELWIDQTLLYEIFLGKMLVFVNGIVAIVALIMGIINDVKQKQVDCWMNRFKILLYLTIMGSYIKFCLQFPVICSVNFRYIVPVILIGAINIGMYMDSKYKNEYLVRAAEGIIVAFAGVSVFIYMFIV